MATTSHCICKQLGMFIFFLKVRLIGMRIVRQGVTGRKKLKSNPDVGSMNNLRGILARLLKVF